MLWTNRVISQIPAKGSPTFLLRCDSCKTDILLDGKDTEWTRNRVPAINTKTTIGCCKDADFLYIHFVTSDPEFSMQVMNFGLTIWFDSQGSQKKETGIEFPIIQMSPPPPRDGKPPVGEELQKFLDERLKEIKIINQKSGKMKLMPLVDARKYGLDATVGVEEGSLCYELKYPLHPTLPKEEIQLHDLKDQIAICIETPEIDFQKIMEKFGEPQEKEGKENKENKKMVPKPPKLTRISQWIRISL
jgi:hypothetical protein